MTGEVVVDHQYVAPGLHEPLADGRGGVRGNELQAGLVFAAGDDDNAVVQGVVLAELGDDLGDGGAALADGAVDADDVLVALVDNGIDRDGGLAGLTVTQDELALAAAYRDQRVDGLDARLQRRLDARAVHDPRRLALDGQALRGAHGTALIQGLARCAHDAPQQRLADGDVEESARAPDLTARLDPRAGIEQHYADLVRVQVEGHAQEVAGEADELLALYAGNPPDARDTLAHIDRGADLLGMSIGRVGIEGALKGSRDALEDRLEGVGFGWHGG